MDPIASLRFLLPLAPLCLSLAACDDGAAGNGTADPIDTSGTELGDTAADDAAIADDTAAADVADDATDATPDVAADATPEATPEATATLDKFSFFLTSLRALQDLSGSDQGFGGDLRFGESGPGAGLRGADKICAAIAERSMPGSAAKGWHAFLSAADGGDGEEVDAIDRIGEGPWYDRLGRVFALTKADLLGDRPTSADAAIKNDFPNEDGVPNHAPDADGEEVDNHDTLTGSNTEGRLYSASAHCNNWTGGTGASSEGKPRVGHSWPRSGGGPGGPGGGQGGGPGGPGGDMDMNNWMSALTESGCAPGVNLRETGAPQQSSNTVGSGGGYGGFYCFASSP